MIFHITPRDEWEAGRLAGEYRSSTRGKTLDDEGFIHCSEAHQVGRVAESFYRDVPDLVLLVIEPASLTAPLRREQPPGSEERFPHLYGALNLDAVVEVRPFTA